MPLFQYFGCVGSFLLAMLLAAQWFFSGPVAPAPPPDLPLNEKISIRIHSEHRWPERLVFETTRSALEPAVPVIAETNFRPGQKLAEAVRH